MAPKTISVQGYSEGHYRVGADHFGGNAILIPNTVDGLPKDNYLAAHRALDATTIRFPAGQPDILFQNGMLQNGRLIPEVRAFLDWAVLHDQRVTLVTPTKAHYPGAAELTEFVRLVMRTYGDRIEAFEVGNEYWSDTDEHDYGRKASESIEAIHDGIFGSGYAPDILVQTANPSGKASLYKGTSDPWVEKVEKSNQIIIDHLSDKARLAVDGVVDHFYYNDDYDAFQGSEGERQFIDRKVEQWREALGRDLEIHVTEWNVRSDNHGQLGMKAASIMLEQFEQMVRMGVDAAQVWATQHNMSNDLGGHWGDDIRVGEDGLVRSSINGAMFDLMSTSLPGLRLLDADLSGIDGTIEVDAYGSQRKVVVYVSSRSEVTQEVRLDLGSLVEGYGEVSGIRLGIDHSTSDGRHWQQSGPNGKGFYDLQPLTVDGQPYFANEHDVGALIEHLDAAALGVADHFEFRLKPYEVMELTFERGQGGRPDLGEEAAYVGVAGNEIAPIRGALALAPREMSKGPDAPDVAYSWTSGDLYMDM